VPAAAAAAVAVIAHAQVSARGHACTRARD
jgi:hypothetical protein